MKILYITNGINGAGGLERVLSIKASMLAEKRGYEVAILGLNQGLKDPFYSFSDKIQWLPISVSSQPLSYIRDYRRGIQQAVDRFNPDIISVCDDGLKGFFIPVFLKTKAPILYERHASKEIERRGGESMLGTWKRQAKWQMMTTLGRRFSSFVVLTEGNRKEWPGFRNLAVIPNPLSFYPNQVSDLNSRQVISVGKISYLKGHDLLMEAWEQVHAKFPDWSLHLYGKENLDFLDTRNLKNNVHFFPPERDIESKYLESALYVLSSRSEGFGMVLIEAMACGLPCVSFDCETGPADIIRDGEDGFLVEKENPRALAEKLILLMGDDARRRKMGAKARENVERYKPDHILDQWEALFHRLLLGSKRGFPSPSRQAAAVD